jgi:hypothetical protein
MLQQTLLLNTPVVNTIGREPQREVEDSSSAEVKLMFRGQVAIVKVGMLLPWTRSRNGLLRMLCTQEVGARLVAIPAFPVPLIPIPTPIPFEDSLLLCTQYHGRHHSCFSISWLPVITRRIHTHTCCCDTSGVGDTCKRAIYWHSFMHVTICSIIHSTINNEYEDSVLLCCRYCTIAFIVWFRAVPVLYFFSLPLLHHDSSHPLFLRSAITCISKAVLIHGVRKAITEGDSENKQVTFSSSLEIDAHFSLTTWESDLSYFLTLHFINWWVIESFGGLWLCSMY